jgi:hypothetical protein
MGDFYGGTLADYIKYCDYRYSGKFKLKKVKIFLTDSLDG